ncbi:MAG TPA: universal stress protein [Myxococcota bacterium]|jgi:nucleotide-binding universal stress UspA family protein|nr:universal stress protein [Myxococcota bacterium]
MRIVLATDFSAHSARATELAVHLARRLADSIVLVHALEPPTMPLPDVPTDLERLRQTIRESAGIELRKAAAALRAQGLSVEERLLDGLADQVIVAVARETDARLVVLGSHGRRAPARWLLGSTAERTMQQADRPVVVVRDTPGALAEWAAAARPLRLLVGVDAGRASEAAVEWVRAFARMVPCDVTLLHFYWPPQEYARLGLHGPRDLVEPDPDVQRVLARDLAHLAAGFGGEGSAKLHVRPCWGSAAEALTLAAASEHADLLVVGTHQRQGLGLLAHGSVARVAVHSAPVPLVSVPAPARSATPGAVPRLSLVLAATDFSDTGNAAVPYAYALLRGAGGHVELVHVRERFFPEAVRGHEPAGAGLAPPERDALEQRLRALVPEGADLHGITTHVAVVESGAPAEGILQAAARLGADAICVGSHGRGGLARAALGSVATEVVRHADRPVFVHRRPRE